MLVIHGERVYGVPIGEALRLWTDLKFRGVDVTFLYFPTRPLGPEAVELPRVVRARAGLP
jgi:hypothetical protein